MSPFLRACVLGLFAFLSLAAPPPASAHHVRWTCWLHGEARVACIVIAAAPAGEPVRKAGTDPQSLLQAVRMRPATLAGQLVFVPLFNVPFDDSLVQQLVRAVLCGAATACDARYQAELQRFIAEAPEHFADLMDPVLAGSTL